MGYLSGVSLKKGRLHSLKVKQKRAVGKKFNLLFWAHTHDAFTKAKIFKLQDLIEHTTLCYVQSGLADKSPNHIKQLWRIKEQGRKGLRGTNAILNPIISSCQWINDLPPNQQAQLWNTSNIEKNRKPSIFKSKNKRRILNEYEDTEEGDN